ncbi:acyltransferase [Epilithonimonas caeni]|uniref:acyltransferase n=1 Tax=Epilithonimonas caeni TaxID=365343 RepID=UPI0003F607CF|nr:acyltransferase [Epilithonimonas caeni]
MGKNFSFRKGFSIVLDGPKANISIGDYCFFNNFCTIAARSKITIGDYSIFGENIKIYDHNHKYKKNEIPIKDQGYTEAPITIGKHCWIASNVIILKGITIGDNCVIGAGCIVHEDVPDNSVLICKQQQILKNN